MKWSTANFVFPFALFVAVEASEHILRLKEGVHAPTTLIGIEENSRVVIRCEHPSGSSENIKWLRTGASIDPKDKSEIVIENYDSVDHDGVYECSAKGMSASYRLRGEKKYDLPEGFRFCVGEEVSNCKHARVCRVEVSSEITSCICEIGWMGANCDSLDTVRSPVLSPPTQQVCSYWTPLVTGILFLSALFILAVCLYKFKVKSYNRPGNYCGHRDNSPKYTAVQGRIVATAEEADVV
ncbi:unnamed protein product [Caenorhabditis auriculariae]|uniref:Ig-like domain-containing protein n=1 Tax=Caenorhabditis auriculariae TaxID=2777116 RepID=A0A8S1H6R1_9PELO|nr:unnamed protein product [Caenorhabditis auriculariae]